LEDLDRGRVRPEFVDACLEDLRWLGLDWDGEVEFQSARAPALEAVAEDLARRGLAYPCVCTRREIEEALSAPHGAPESSPYPGTCRGRYGSRAEARAATGREPALRLGVGGRPITIEDARRGSLTQNLAREVGDFPITSRDGQVSYQLAVVLDDARSGVTEVLRGEDLLASTPRQRFLQELLGLPAPRWVHVPLVLDESGERLAKRHDALSLRALRRAGVAPESLVGWLGRALGQDCAPRARPADLLARFALERLPRAPLVFGRATFESLKDPHSPGEKSSRRR